MEHEEDRLSGKEPHVVSVDPAKEHDHFARPNPFAGYAIYNPLSTNGVKAEPMAGKKNAEPKPTRQQLTLLE